MRSQAQHLHHGAERTRAHELGGPDRGAALEALGEEDGVDAPRLALHAAHLGQVVQRGHARLVDQVVLLVPHHAQAERRALARDARRRDHRDRRVLEDRALVLDPLRLRKGALKARRQLRLRRVPGRELRPVGEQRL